MYPNPQAALPLPAKPNLEQYRKRAKDLVRACRSGEPNAIRAWAVAWIEALAAREPDGDRRIIRSDISHDPDEVATFAEAKLTGSSAKCVLADAQFVMARAHGFTSWPKLVAHLESLSRASSHVSAFEQAVDAVIAGDISALRRLLSENPGLLHERSTREHNATLLHYVSANGVEGYRQISPQNAAQVAALLLEAGAQVEARADVYGGGWTTLGLVATSAPPAIAGVQRDVIDVLLDHGARIDLAGTGGHNDSLVRSCLANGQPAAAEYLVSRGAPLDLPGAAGLGRVDVARGFFTSSGDLQPNVTKAQLLDAFSLACAYGRVGAVELFLDRGVDVDVEMRGHGEGHTGLHVAAFYGHADVVDALIRRSARVDIIDKTWRTPPLVWALTGWSRDMTTDRSRYYRVVARLVAAGANVTPDLLEWEKARADPKMIAALTNG